VARMKKNKTQTELKSVTTHWFQKHVLETYCKCCGVLLCICSDTAGPGAAKLHLPPRRYLLIQQPLLLRLLWVCSLVGPAASVKPSHLHVLAI
jgi:hypothetical protein